MTAAADRPGVLCVGRVYCDLVFTDLPRLPTLGTETFAGGLSLHPGGGAAITAAYLAALGRPAFLGAFLPADPFGTQVAQELSRLAVDCSFARFAAAGLDPQVTVAMATGGDRAFVTRDAGPAAPAFDAAALRDAGIGHLHVGELKTLAERPDLLDLAEAAGLTVSLDCGWDDGLTTQAAALIERVAVFLPNADELDRLEAMGLTPRGQMVTAVKRGAEGARALVGDTMTEARAHPAKVVDTTGAGDAFNGGFLHGWLEGLPLAECLAEGIACGTQAVSAAGGTTGALAIRQDRLGLAAAQ